jgi:glycosyltransferase involved in cell wall biosynthesis
MNRRLVVVGAGRLRDTLARRAGGGGSVVFLGRVSDETLRDVYSNARALLFPGLEDFGIVPVEAQAAGLPVIAFGRGGARETVRPGETGVFFNEQTVESLCEGIEAFEAARWEAENCRRNAAGFSRERFLDKMSSFCFRSL